MDNGLHLITIREFPDMSLKIISMILAFLLSGGGWWGFGYFFGANQHPVALNDAYTIDAGSEAILAVLLNDTDPEGDDVSIVSVTTPGAGNVVISEDQSSLIFTAEKAGEGEVSFSYVIADEQGNEAEANVKVVVKAENTPPIAVGDIYTIDAGSEAILAVLLNDTDPEGDDVSIVSVTTPEAGDVVISEDQSSLIFTAEKAGEGEVSFSYVIADEQGNEAEANVKVVVKAESVIDLTEVEAARFLTHGTFGVTRNDMDHLMEKGIDGWLEEQFNLPACKHYDDQLRFTAVNNSLGVREQLRDQIWWENAVGCKAQLRERVGFALSQIFVVSDKDSLIRYHPDGLSDYYDMLIENSFGNFRDLLLNVTLHPIMGSYLNMLGNEKSDVSLNVRADENFAREVMQLFSIGLTDLNLDGTEKLDSSGNAIPTYTQADVEALARVFTGWSLDSVVDDNEWIRLKKYPQLHSWEDFITPMKSFASFHDFTEKTVMGTYFPAYQTPESDLEIAIDMLFNHSSLPPFISKQLIQRLVSSNPSPDYVERVSMRFVDNGEGVRGDIFAVVKAILTDPESSQGNSKLVEPMIRMTQIWRAFGVPASGLTFMNAYLYLGQESLASPSVFNFYRPTDSIATDDGILLAPEFNLIDADRLIRTTNILGHMTLRGYLGYSDDLYTYSARLDYKPYVDLLDENPSGFLDEISLIFYGGEMTRKVDNILTSFIGNMRAVGVDSVSIVAEVVHLVVVSPQYLIQ